MKLAWVMVAFLRSGVCGLWVILNKSDFVLRTVFNITFRCGG